MSIPTPSLAKNGCTLEGLHAELLHANRVLQTSLREVREGRALIMKIEADLQTQTCIIEQQKNEILEWMHAAAAHKMMAEQAYEKLQRPSEPMASKLAGCILECAQNDGRFRHTDLLVMALEHLAENR